MSLKFMIFDDLHPYGMLIRGIRFILTKTKSSSLSNLLSWFRTTGFQFAVILLFP